MNFRTLNASFMVVVLGLLSGVERQCHAGLIGITTTALSSNGAEIPTNLPVVVHAWNVNGNAAAPPVVNGITFSNTQPSQITLSAAFNAFVANAAATEAHYTGDMPEIMGDLVGTAPVTSGLLTLTDLIVGRPYDVTFLHHQDINANGQRDMEVHFGNSGAGAGGGAKDVGNNQGYITIARFIADTPSQSFFFRVGGNDRAILNAVIVQTIPEPSSVITWSMGALALGSAFFIFRRRMVGPQATRG